MVTHYRQHAQAYADATRSVDMSPLYARFTPHLPAGGRVLDVGCGSGRDARAFAQQGFRVTAFDASPELAQLAARYTGLPVVVADVLALDGPATLDLPPDTLFDGIWACASLLHVPEARQARAWACLWPLLRPGGRLVYATCSVFRAEGADQAQAFLQRHTDARPAPAPGHLFPGIPGTQGEFNDNRSGGPDGFFYACFDKARPR